MYMALQSALAQFVTTCIQSRSILIGTGPKVCVCGGGGGGRQKLKMSIAIRVNTFII